jgi:hypothetical protein
VPEPLIETLRVIGAGIVGLGRLTLSRRERMVVVEPRGTGMALMNNFTWTDAGIPEDDPRTVSRICHELSARVVLTPSRHQTGLQTGEIGIARSWHSWSSGGGSKLSHKPISD